MKKMIVSIIVCTKDEINNLDNCIRGILSFELPDNVDYELIFIDGISTDGTYEKIKKIVKSENRL